MYKVSAPIYAVDITKEEKEQASNTRIKFKEFIEGMDEAFEHVYRLDEALEGITDSAQFITMAKLFLRYKRKLRSLFNVLIKQLEDALKDLNETISDNEMERIRDTIVGEVREIRDGIIEIIDLLDNTQSSSFIKSFKEVVDRIEKRERALREVITDQLFAHIDYDILGRIRLGFESHPLEKTSGSHPSRKKKELILTIRTSSGLDMEKHFDEGVWLYKDVKAAAEAFVKPGIIVLLKPNYDNAREGDKAIGYWEEVNYGDGQGWQKILRRTAI